eukprot:SAG11_NODE_3405_length_2466_cov_2.931559_1_plen_60_part_00
MYAHAVAMKDMHTCLEVHLSTCIGGVQVCPRRSSLHETGFILSVPTSAVHVWCERYYLD